MRGLVGRASAPPGVPDVAGAGVRRDAGFVVAEAAIAVPLLLAVTCALAWALSIASASVALGDAARQAARDLARGVSVEQALDQAARGVPGADVTIVDDGDPVRVVATREVAAPVPVLGGLSFTVRQGVSVPREWL